MQKDARLTGAKRYAAYGQLDMNISKSAVPWASMGDTTNQFFYSSKVAPGTMVYQSVYRTRPSTSSPSSKRRRGTEEAPRRGAGSGRRLVVFRLEL